MKSRVWALVYAVLALAGCGGGGAGSPGGPPVEECGGGAACPVPVTLASGVVVDDPSGAPIAGLPVRIAPWTAGATPLPSPQTTTGADGSFSFTAPQGHYLLIIGSDSSADTTRPTIHDNITLSGGTVTLQAPTLPAVPTITKPAVETGGKYRLMTIDASSEAPCFVAFNAERTSRALPLVVVDEWLLENARELNQYRISAGYNVNTPGSALTTGGVIGAGGTDCSQGTASAFIANATYAADSRTEWFAGSYLNPPGSGVLEFPIDPRAFTDPNFPTWF